MLYQIFKSVLAHEVLNSQRLCGQLRLSFLSEEQQLNCFRSMEPVGALPPTPAPLPSFTPMPLSHFHAPFQGKEGREKANKQALFPEFIFSTGTR